MLSRISPTNYIETKIQDIQLFQSNNPSQNINNNYEFYISDFFKNSKEIKANFKNKCWLDSDKLINNYKIGEKKSEEKITMNSIL